MFKTNGSLPILIIWGSVETGETEGTILADTLCRYPRVFVLDNNSKIGCISLSETSFEYLDLKTKVLGKYDLAEPGIWGITSYDVRGTQLPVVSE